MKFVGLTGGIGSGKTTVARFFENLGVPVYNSDTRAKELMETSAKVRNAIKKLLGEKAYNGKTLNRNYIAEQVFHDRPLLEQLNGIVHPAVRNDFLNWAELQDFDYVIQEAAVIFEIGSQNFYDCVILVTAPETLRIERVTKRDANTSTQDVKARIRNQMSDSEKIKLCDIHLENIDLIETESRVFEIHRKLLVNS